MAKKKFLSVQEYILAAPKKVQPVLRKIRKEIRQRLPLATETIAYNMPAFQHDQTFFYFAAFKNHIGVYPPLKDPKLKKQLKVYSNEKGNLSFPLDETIPYNLIVRVAVALSKQYKA